MVETVEVIIKQQGHQDRVVRLQEGATRMGRAEDNEIVLSDVGVSRRHSQIYVSRGEVTVEDLGSGNGTYYNGYRVQSQPIRDGDEIVIDPFVLQFRIRGQESAPNLGGGGAQAPARLDVVVGTGLAGSSYPITARGLSIGRSEDRDVVIPDPAASRHHCQISESGADHVLRDMGSANGVFVNAVRVRECTLQDGDLVRIGNTEMRFVRHDGRGGESTTNVHGAQPTPNVPGPAAEMPRPVPVAQPAVVKRSSGPSKPLIALLFGGLIAVVGVLIVLVLILLAVGIWIQFRPVATAPELAPHEEPQWTLQLPNGLPENTLDELFKHGSDSMKTDLNVALEDFYRVMKADPGYPFVRLFAFSAGENMVVGVMQNELQERSKLTAERNALRDRLLRDSAKSNRTGRNAKARLEREFREDPKVIAHFSWAATPNIRELEKLHSKGKGHMAKGEVDDAIEAFREVIARSQDPATRKAAEVELLAGERKLAQLTKREWEAAMLARAAGDRVGAKALFTELAAKHPAHVSARLHAARL